MLDFFPELAPENPDDHLKAMRIHDLLRMATGHETEPPVREANAPWAATFLSHPVPHRPGTHFLYNTPANLPREWVAAATSLQVANGSNPASDWNQGYGYQFWRSRHSSYRGDGAFGQYCIVMPDQDAVVVITSGVADMQAVMSLVFEKLLPAFRAAPLPENPAATKALNDALATLTVRLPVGEATAPRGHGVVGHTYVFPENELGLESLTLNAGSEQMVVTVRTADGEQRIPVGLGDWAQSRSRFVFGLDTSPGLPTEAAAIAAAGAWPEKNSLVVKLVMYETPYYTTVSLRFDGAELHLATEANVSFAPERRIELVGRRS